MRFARSSNNLANFLVTIFWVALWSVSMFLGSIAFTISRKTNRWFFAVMIFSMSIAFIGGSFFGIIKFVFVTLSVGL